MQFQSKNILADDSGTKSRLGTPADFDALFGFFLQSQNRKAISRNDLQHF